MTNKTAFTIAIVLLILGTISLIIGYFKPVFVFAGWMFYATSILFYAKFDE